MRRLGIFPVDCPEVGLEEIAIDLLQARFWITSVADDSTTLGGAHLLPRSSCVKDKPPSDKRFQHSNLADLLGHN